MAENTQSVLERTAADQWKVLPSGLTVLVRPMPGYSGTHVIYATRFGSIDRDFRLGEREVHLPAGVAHFLEHKMFEDEDGDAFAKFAKTGANANAFTAFDRTCYLFTATEQLDESLDVLLGMVGHPYFTEQTIAKEQGIIGQEIKMYDDSPDWRLITGLCECMVRPLLYEQLHGTPHDGQFQPRMGNRRRAARRDAGCQPHLDVASFPWS